MLVLSMASAILSDDQSDTGERPVVRVMVQFDQTELDGLLAAYEPESGTSPSCGDCRPILRAILNAALEAAPPSPPE
jgi:hypothetical protein